METVVSIPESCVVTETRSPAPETAPEIARMHLKWFNASKGFGFLVPEDETFDAFVHVTILQDAGLNGAGEGAIFDCEIYDSDKGKQVRRIVEVITPGEIPKPFLNETECGDTVIGGIVKWYKPEKGFGFIIADDGQKDVFIHRTLLVRSEVETLEEGQRVKMTVKAVDKGREATTLELLS